MNKSILRPLSVSLLSLMIASALSACGGGSGVRPTPPTPPNPPSNPCDSNPNAPNCNPDDGNGGDNGGDNGGSSTSYQYPQDNQLVPTHVKEAHKDGFTGKHVKVAVIDSGIDLSNPMFDNLKDGKNVHFHSFLGKDSQTPNETSGHGSIMAGIIAGSKVVDSDNNVTFAGGVAPDVDLYVGQVCDDSTCQVGSDAVNYYLDQGVRLFNYSMGRPASGNKDSDASFNDFMSSTYQDAVDKGALFVWAAGNDGSDKISQYATAPYYKPDLEKGWIVAANVDVDPDDGHVTGLYDGSADGSNGGKGSGISSNCGVTMDFCVSAPGVTISPSIKGSSDFDNGNSPVYTSGTSNATAVITGVSALVWQAYPWMTGHNVQQTVLTTADHLSSAENDPTVSYKDTTTYKPNARYGWGLVNAERAVHGPGQFDSDFDANIGSYESEFSNGIAGLGSLTLSGNDDGVLTLSADNTYSGGTTINSATLKLSGSLASNVTINGGTLGGDGVVNGLVNNVAGGVFSTSSKAGNGLTIKGDYTAGKDSMTAVSIGNTLNIGGTASLDGDLYVMPVNDEKYTPENTETLIHAGSGVDGTFSHVNEDNLTMYNADVSYDPNNVLATITRKSVSSAVSLSSPVVANTANGLEQSLEKADEWSKTDASYATHNDFLNQSAKFLSAPSKELATASVASLSGEIYGTSHTMEVIQAHHVGDAIATHQMVTQSNGESDGASVWVQYLNNSGNLSKSGYAKTHYNGHATLLGLDINLDSNAKVGAFVGTNKSNNRMNGLSGNTRENNKLFGVYGSYSLGDAYVLGNASWTKVDMDVSRNILLGTNTYGVKGSRTDHIGQLNVEAGRHFGFVTPYLGWSKTWLRQDAFAEKGTVVNGVDMSQLALSSPKQNLSTSSANVGVRFNHDFKWGNNTSTLYGFVNYRKTLNGKNMNFKASFNGTPDSQFEASGQPLVNHMTQVGVTLNTDMNSTWSWYVGAQEDISSSRYHAFSANAGISYHF